MKEAMTPDSGQDRQQGTTSVGSRRKESCNTTAHVPENDPGSTDIFRKAIHMVVRHYI